MLREYPDVHNENLVRVLRITEPIYECKETLEKLAEKAERPRGLTLLQKEQYLRKQKELRWRNIWFMFRVNFRNCSTCLDGYDTAEIKCAYELLQNLQECYYEASELLADFLVKAGVPFTTYETTDYADDSADDSADELTADINRRNRIVKEKIP